MHRSFTEPAYILLHLYMVIEARRNAVAEVEMGAFSRTEATVGNVTGNAFAPKETVLMTEGREMCDAAPGRTWHVANPHVVSSVIVTPVSCELVPR